MSDALVKAHLNLCAVLQNLEDLVLLDEEMAALTESWRIAIEFRARGGPSASVAFRDGRCTHASGTQPAPDVRLYFFSPAHLNRMFDGKGSPLPLKGFTKLGFLSREFSKLTQRLEHYLKPGAESLADAAFRRVNTTLTLYTGVHAAAVLARYEPVSRALIAGAPRGVLSVRVGEDGPAAWLNNGGDGVTVGKGVAERPAALMQFTDIEAAHEVLSVKLDSMTSIGLGKLALHGQIPLVENVGLIMDRVQGYLA